ncbi:MAG TPA: proton-conducting transporter membrane subunit [Gemmatimonadales bacterium]|jgi:hydrogenase-4 component F|nr:proton-conducting transporter membrane subunit [Gemmatimonadales bacterium]
MLLLALVLLPALGALGAYLHRAEARRTAWLVAVAAIHLALVTLVWTTPPPAVFSGWIAVDALGLIVLTLTSLLFFVAAIYTVGYLRRESPRGGRAFVSCVLAFLASVSLVALSHHFAVLWIALEASTLAVAPLIFHRRDRRSLEAVWKYLVISSVAIALALLGTFFLSTAQANSAGTPLLLEDLVADAARLHPAWLKAAFILLLVGYGTKMGLAPMHTWKPDTYGEAPSVVGALMAGALTSAAFLGLARINEVTTAAGISAFTRPLLLFFGLFSIVVAAAFVIGQTDVKRLLAYSSVEHMGLLAVGLGLGGVGAYGATLHIVTNGLTKGLLFLVLGNVILVAGTTQAGAMHGLAKRLPISGGLLLLGLFAVTGSPPSGVFISEFAILRAAFAEGHVWVGVVLLILLVVIFLGLATTILKIVHGTPERREPRESGWLVLGPIGLAAGVILLGIYIPAPLQSALRQAAAALGGVAP